MGKTIKVTKPKATLMAKKRAKAASAQLPCLPAHRPHHGRWLVENMHIGVEFPDADRSDPPRAVSCGEKAPSKRRRL